MSSEQNTTSIFRDRYFNIGMAIYTGYPENKKKSFPLIEVWPFTKAI
jgi:hypothetical protein